MAAAAPPTLQAVPQVKGLGAAFAALPQLVGTAQGKMQAAQMAYDNFMQQLPLMLKVYEYNHPSAYQQGMLSYDQGRLGYDQSLLGIDQQRLGIEAQNAATSAGRLGIAQNEYNALYGTNGLDRIKTALSGYMDSVSAWQKQYDAALSKWKAQHPSTGMTLPSAGLPSLPAPPKAPDLSGVFDYLGSLGLGTATGTTVAPPPAIPPAKPSAPKNSTPIGGGKKKSSKNPLGL